MTQRELTEPHDFSQDDTTTATLSDALFGTAATALERALLQEITELKGQVQLLNKRLEKTEEDLTLVHETFPSWFKPKDTDETYSGMSYESSLSDSLTENQEGTRNGRSAEGATRDKLPMTTLAIAGGLTLVVGALLFIWKATELTWISEETRLMLVGAGALAMLLMAPKTHNRIAAQGLGGAGLGIWFAVWLVAHFGDLDDVEVDLITMLVGLASASALCLMVAERKGLRLMANVGALAALSTPIFILFERNNLTELMISLLIIMSALVLLEHRVGARMMDRRESRASEGDDAELLTRWPELGHLGMVGTWVAVGIVAIIHPDWSDPEELLVWTGIFLVATGIQTLLLRTEGLRSIHAVSRCLLGGLAAWVISSLTLPSSPALLGWITLAMAVWHLWIFWWSTNYGRSALLHGPLIALAWIQLFTFGPLHWAGVSKLVVTWWLAQALLGAAMTRIWSKWRVTALVALPLTGALTWSLIASPDVETFQKGLCGVALLVGVTLTPKRNDAGWSLLMDRVTTLLLPAAAVIGGLLAWRHTKNTTMSLGHDVIAVLVIGAIATLGALSVCLRADDRPQAKATLLVIIIGLAWTIWYVTTASVIGTTGPDAHSTRLILASIALGFGVLGLNVLYSVRNRSTYEVPPEDFNHDMAGILAITALMLSVQMLMSTGIHLLPSIGAYRANQISISALVALGAIIIMAMGLRYDRKRWITVAWGGLLIACTKTVIFDTAIPGIYRVLSVMGLGACMLLGAFAYERIKGRRGTTSLPDRERHPATCN